jgi:hypothetical protein
MAEGFISDASYSLEEAKQAINAREGSIIEPLGGLRNALSYLSKLLLDF